ncbi:uncharacterized protein LOC129596061 isoform X2 [Paramacrobiotus metropolitanus]|uniref:uncharacterized protein LOC129596061 isoform X2 n=1 Tax=Paramacrobiotus metropolitanus TaxID=2943436 RepID=UPI002445A47A|nr:uncharacterized protein LOC129596061 isoform X2 [Paramacrobiotus metropolitanus]
MDNSSGLCVDPSNLCLPNSSNFNESADLDLKFTQEDIDLSLLFGNFSYLVLLVVCSVGNSLNFLVLTNSRRKWKSSAWCYMLGTSTADLAAIWMGFPYFLWNLAEQYRLPLSAQNNEPLITLLTGVTGWGEAACMRLSDWILVAFSWERLLIIISPFRFDFLQRHSVYYANQQYDFSTPLDNAAWLTSWGRVYNTAQVFVQLLTFFLVLLPSIVLIIFIRRRRSAAINRSKVKPAVPRAALDTGEFCIHPKTMRHHVGINVILLSSAALYLITRFPHIVFLCIFRLAQQFESDQTVEYFVAPIIYVIMYLGYSLTFFIYISMHRLYRERFIKLIVDPLRARSNEYISRSGGGWKDWMISFMTGQSISAAAATASVTSNTYIPMKSVQKISGRISLSRRERLRATTM